MLSDREADPETGRLVETMERNVVRLGEVAGKLERLARLTRRSDNAPNEQQVDLAAVVNDVVGQLRDMAEARGVVFEVDPDLPTLAADAGRVELVVMNLLANAIKYSDPDKSVRQVTVELPTSLARTPGCGFVTTASGSRSRSSTRSSISSCARIPTSTTSSARKASGWGSPSYARAWRRWAAS